MPTFAFFQGGRRIHTVTGADARQLEAAFNMCLAGEAPAVAQDAAAAAEADASGVPGQVGLKFEREPSKEKSR